MVHTSYDVYPVAGGRRSRKRRPAKNVPTKSRLRASPLRNSSNISRSSNRSNNRGSSSSNISRSSQSFQPLRGRLLRHHKSRMRASPKQRHNDTIRMSVVNADSIGRFADPMGERGCLHAFRRTELLGKGVWGEVYAACGPPRGGCGYALKVSVVENASDRRVAERDPYFLRLLDGLLVDGKRSVPRLINSWSCPRSGRDGCERANICPTSMREHDHEVFMVVMERYDGNVFSLGIERAIAAGLPGASKEAEVALYEVDELLRMYRINWQFGEKAGVLYMDSKPDNFLQRQNGKQIVATDFGFAGRIGRHGPYAAEMGWPSNEQSHMSFQVCPPNRVDFVNNRKLAALVNIWQLEAYLISAGTQTSTFVRDHNGRIKRFVGIRNFDRALAAANFDQQFCPDFTSAWQDVTRRWARMRDFPTLQFSLTQITKTTI